jgi:hypothetical protein
VTTQRLEEGLEAAAHQAAQDLSVDLNLADTRCPLDLPSGRDADEADFDALCHWLPGHAPRLGRAPGADIDGIRDWVAIPPARMPVVAAGAKWPEAARSRAGVDLLARYWFDDAIQAAIRARVLAPSLFRMLRTWLSTVCSEMNRRAPISLLLRPSATSRATSASRLESNSAPAPPVSAAVPHRALP